jgi:membrane fusion protein, multidrug efflux system
MPTVDLIRRARGRFTGRRSLLLIGTPLIIGAVVLAVVTRGSGTADGGRLGPTVVAEPRDLVTTLEAPGSLQRSDEHTVAYAAALPSRGGEAPDDQGGDSGNGDGGNGDGGNGDGGNGAGGNGAGGNGAGRNGDAGNGGVTPAAFLTGPRSTSSSSTSTTSSTTPTTNPCSPTSSSSTTSSSSSTTSTTPCPTTTSTTSTTTPTTSTTTPPTSTTTPAPGTTPTTRPRSGGGGTSSPSTADPGATGGADGGAGSGPGAAMPADGGGTAAPDDRPGGGDGGNGDDGSGEVPSAILTSVLDVGATVDRGTVLYTADDQPVVALIGELPAWRTLEQGVDDGADVRQLEESLVALGYGDDLAVDDSFTAETAAAVEAWETDLGRTAADGVVTIGEVVFLSERRDVLGHEASVGDTLEAGSPVMTIGSEQRLVVADVDATEAGGWNPGSTVELEWADGTTTEGTVLGTGREVTDGQVELTVAVGAGESGAGQRRSGAEATVTLVDARRDGVLAVPVAAIVDDGGSPAVRVARADGADQVVPVETGLVADGWIEITAGLDGGEEIRLPG